LGALRQRPSLAVDKPCQLCLRKETCIRPANVDAMEINLKIKGNPQAASQP
jgi:hypothetical protein